MIDEKHTPGPWRAADETSYMPLPHEDQECLACVEHGTFDAVEIYTPPRDHNSLDEHLANVRLIEAAPQLFSLLERVIHEADESPLVRDAIEFLEYVRFGRRG